MVYWNVWDNRKFTDPREIEILKLVSAAVKPDGRLVLGFYDAKKENNMARINKLKELGFNSNGVLENSLGVQAICWFDS